MAGARLILCCSYYRNNCGWVYSTEYRDLCARRVCTIGSPQQQHYQQRAEHNAATVSAQKNETQLRHSPTTVLIMPLAQQAGEAGRALCLVFNQYIHPSDNRIRVKEAIVLLGGV